MNIKVTIIVLLTSILSLYGCAKEISVAEHETDQTEPRTTLRDFAEILSSAVYSEPALRDFIKSEALKEFDRDYDVFYPFVKDEIVSEGQTFSQVLKKYDTKNRLQEIEIQEPLLNILVPDWSWVDKDCFSVNSWDTSIREVAVTYDSPGSEIPLYGNGQHFDTLKSGEFVSVPVLVVKRNERMVYNPSKSGPLEYDFYDPVYDGSHKIETKGTWHEYVYDFDVPSPVNYVHPMSLPTKVRTAYYESSNNSNMIQRDGIYYNMTAVRDTGVVDFHFAESLLRFRFASANLDALSDDPYSENQMSLNEIAFNYGQAISEDALKQYGWIEGNYELLIIIKAGDTPIEKALPSKSISNAFSVDKVHFQWYQDIFNTVTYRRYWVEIDDLIPKWVNLNEELFTWDLSDYPMKYIVEFKERDTGATTVLSGSQSYQFATNFNTSGEWGSGNVKIGYGSGVSSQVNRTFNWSVTLTDADDNLGSSFVQYVNPIVTNISGSKATLMTYSTGSIKFQVLPIQIVNQ